jgi:NarL family two-component system response regulator LiaR
MDSIRIFVVDDHPMVRHGMVAMLGTEKGLRWVGEAGSGEDALRLAPGLLPHVVVVDTSLPDMDALAALTALRPLLPKTRFLLLGEEALATESRRMLDAGATGYLNKAASTAELVQAIRRVHRGEVTLPTQRSARQRERQAPGATGADLTLRERELLNLMAQGLSNQEIATELTIAMPTVKFHVTNVLKKLKADNRTEAVLVALRSQIVDLK